MGRVYLGIAIQNPPVINGFGRIQLIDDRALIEQSIKDRLLTPVGSEFFNRQNGSILSLLLHQPNDAVLLDLLDFHIKNTIETQERRVKYVGTEFFNDASRPDLVQCKISVMILQSSETFSFVFDFYRELAN